MRTCAPAIRRPDPPPRELRRPQRSIPGIVNDPKRWERYADCVDWALAESLLPLGGVRIEDNVLVTSSGRENVTAEIPEHAVD